MKVGTRGLLLAAVAISWTATQVAGQESAANSDSDPMAFLQPLIGTWVPDQAWLDDNPGLDSLIPLALEWGPTRHSVVYQAGLLDRAGRPYTQGSIVWNPAIKRAEFLVSQGSDGLLFEGYYEAVDSETIRRTYTVLYPDNPPLRFRETFFFIGPDTIDWLTEWAPEGAWVPRRGTGDPEFRATRAPVEPSEVLKSLERLVGRWSPDPSRIPERMAEWRARTGITDEIVTFEWGTGQRWIEFGEHREQDGNWRVEGSGLIAADPHTHTITYTEHTDSGVTLRGTVVIADALTIERHYRSYAPNGVINSWVDRWRWDSADAPCFEWTTTDMTNGQGSAWPAHWVCRQG